MLVSLLLVPLLVALAPAEGDLERAGISDRDLEKNAKPVNGFFEAVGVDDRGAQQEHLEDLISAMDKSLKRAKASEGATAYLGDWDALLEFAKPISREVKKVVGKGLVPYTFVDPYNGDMRVQALISIPKAYSKAKTFFPTIVALKPALGLQGDELVAAATAKAEAIYGTMLEDYIVLVPLGIETGTGRDATLNEVSDGWMTEQGFITYFFSFRILFEQVRFDRSRVMLDGWGDAGTEAMWMATSSPSFYAGVINRGGQPDADGMMLSNLNGAAVLYVQDAGAQGVDLGRVGADAVDGVRCTVVATEGSAVEPDSELAQAVSEWAGSVRKNLAPAEIRYQVGDIMFGNIHWLKALEINRRSTAKPGDKDFPSINARVDAGTNTIRIETVNVLELMVYLSDALLDLSKPVTIEVNGETKFEGEVEASVRTLLENRYYNDSGDYGLYTASVRLEDIDANVP